MDFRPARVDTSVSKFMIESPELVASIDPETILKAKAYRKLLLSQPQLADHPFMAYVKDVEHMTVALDKVFRPKNYVAIIDLKRDYRTEFIANLCNEGTSETIGDFQMHSMVSPDGESISVALPQPRTLIIGNSFTVTNLLERNAHPKLYPRESELIASTLGNDGINAKMHFDSLKIAAAHLREEAKKGLEEFDEEKHGAAAGMMEMIDQTSKDVTYAANNIKHITVEVEFDHDLKFSVIAECGSAGKATKIASIYSSLSNNFPASGPMHIAESKPFTEGSTVVTNVTIDLDEITTAINLAVRNQEF